jgi:hypothetical protein
MLAVVALAVAGLAGCSVQGDSTERWLGRSLIIDSTVMDAAGCFGTCDVTVDGTISESATGEQVRQLSEAATDYLITRGRTDIAMSLTFGTVTFWIGDSQAETAAMVDLALTAATDDRVSAATVGLSSATLSGSQADVLALFDDYADTDDTVIRVVSDDDRGNEYEDDYSVFIVEESADQCDTAASQLAEFDLLMDDPTVTSVELTLCTELKVTVTDESSVDPMVARIQLLASAPEYSAMLFSVDSVAGLPYSISAETPQLNALLAVFDSTPGLASYTHTDSVLEVKVSDPARFRPIVEMIDAAPRPSFIYETLVSYASVSVYVDGDGTLAAQLITAESILAANAARDTAHQISFNTRSSGSLDFKPSNYDEDAGRRIVDAVMAGGLWKTTGTKISALGVPVDFSVYAEAGSSLLEVTKTDEKPETSRLIEELNDYWAAQVGSG